MIITQTKLAMTPNEQIFPSDNSAEDKGIFITAPSKTGENRLTMEEIRHTMGKGRHTIGISKHALGNRRRAVGHSMHTLDNRQHTMGIHEHTMDNRKHTMGNKSLVIIW
ncbi:MAG: hypothetical protein LBK60_02275 [Verrucomicrobiales bacterium]|nr:hypothetical protein [Verrucomicrobiales bacterium]